MKTKLTPKIYTGAKQYLLVFGLIIGLVFSSMAIFTQKAYAAPKCFAVQLGSGGFYYKSISCPQSAEGFDPSIDSAQSLTCFVQSVNNSNVYQTMNCFEIAALNQSCIEQACFPGATADGTGGSDTAGSDPYSSKPPSHEKTCDGRGSNVEKCLKENPIINWIQLFINTLSVGVGVIITSMIIIGGIQYSGAGGNPQTVAAAKRKIYNAIFALLSFLFLYAALQWLAPGGVF